MEQLLQLELGDGTVLAEVSNDEPGIELAAQVDDSVAKADASFEAAMDQVRAFANATLAKIQDLARQPAQVEVDFGIRLNARAGAVIARTPTEGHLQVKLSWTLPKAGAGPTAN